jgi:hypothetical protein
MSREWKVDGPDLPPRSPTTHEEIAIAIGLLQEQSADIKAASAQPYDNVHALGVEPMTLPKQQQGKPPGNYIPSVSCSYCHIENNHVIDICPQKAADWRKDNVKILAAHARTGRRCNLCGGPGYEDRDHMMAVTDYANRSNGGNQGAQTKGRGKEGESKGCKGGRGGKSALGKNKCHTCHQYGHEAKDCPQGPKGPNAPAYAGNPKVQCPPHMTPCKYKAKCNKFDGGGKCEHWHVFEEMQALKKKFTILCAPQVKCSSRK